VIGLKSASGLIVTKRKVFEIAGSLVVTLPKKWAEKHGVKPGDVVVVIGDKAIKIVLPPEETI